MAGRSVCGLSPGCFPLDLAYSGGEHHVEEWPQRGEFGDSRAAVVIQAARVDAWSHNKSQGQQGAIP
jgi:hypothetical protein